MLSSSTLSRRALLGTSVAVGGSALAGLTPDLSLAAPQRWAARPPAGFSRLSIPGKIVKVQKSNWAQSGGLFPEQSAARLMLERAMTELTGRPSLAEAFKAIVHPSEKVAIKPNGIAGRKTQQMAANKELVLEVALGLVAAGVKPENITIFEQYRDFLWGTRIVTDRQLNLDPAFPAGIKTAVHLNSDAVMGSITVGGIPTQYVRPFTDATAVINVTQIKDHSICGYTGTLKNITHGCNINPHAFHEHNASPQIAHLYAQEVVKSRVVLHITDAYKVIYDKGPLDNNPKTRVPFGAVYACTDPVAMDVIGWGVIEQLRRDNGLPTLAGAGREPTYIRVAGELGLGVYDKNLIRVRDLTV